MDELKVYLKELIDEFVNVAVITSKVNEHDSRLTNHNDRIMFLELSDARREERDKTIIEKLNKIQTVTEELALKPTKKWDLISAVVISSVISGIIGFFFITFIYVAVLYKSEVVRRGIFYLWAKNSPPQVRKSSLLHKKTKIINHLDVQEGQGCFIITCLLNNFRLFSESFCFFYLKIV